jgi:hypothetical protein
MERVTQEPAKVIPLTMQDITPVTNGVHHLNGLGELPEGTKAPCIGIGLTSPLPLSGAAPGVTNVSALEVAVRYAVEVIKGFLTGNFSFYDEEEYSSLVSMYGDMSRLNGLRISLIASLRRIPRLQIHGTLSSHLLSANISKAERPL